MTHTTDTAIAAIAPAQQSGATGLVHEIANDRTIATTTATDVSVTRGTARVSEGTGMTTGGVAGATRMTMPLSPAAAAAVTPATVTMTVTATVVVRGLWTGAPATTIRLVAHDHVIAVGAMSGGDGAAAASAADEGTRAHLQGGLRLSRGRSRQWRRPCWQHLATCSRRLMRTRSAR